MLNTIVILSVLGGFNVINMERPWARRSFIVIPLPSHADPLLTSYNIASNVANLLSYIQEHMHLDGWLMGFEALDLITHL